MLSAQNIPFGPAIRVSRRSGPFSRSPAASPAGFPRLRPGPSAAGWRRPGSQLRRGGEVVRGLNEGIMLAGRPHGARLNVLLLFGIFFVFRFSDFLSPSRWSVRILIGVGAPGVLVVEKKGEKSCWSFSFARPRGFRFFSRGFSCLGGGLSCAAFVRVRVAVRSICRFLRD